MSIKSSVQFPGESAAYRQARNELLQAEIELRRHTEQVAALRRQLPPGGVVPENYVFEEGAADLTDTQTVRQVSFSELFAPDKNTLIAYNFMFSAQMERPCPFCTSMLDALHGNARHAAERVNLVVIAKSPIARIREFARARGWRKVSLERELEFLKCYLEIQQVRFHDRLRVTMQIEPAALSVQVPNLILQPLVENAIKHGIAPRADAGHIGIRARLTHDTLQVEVSNDGPRLAANGNRTRHGVGLANTRERLRQLYQERFQLDLQTRAEGGAVCTLALPLTEGGSHA